MLNELYYSKKEEKYYFLGLNPCYKCNKLIDDIIFIIRVYSKSEKKMIYSCKNCVKYKLKIPFIYKDTITSVCVNSLPKDAFPVFNLPPTISNRTNSDTFILATKNFEGEKVIDRAFQCHNKDFMIDNNAKNQEQLKYEKEDIKLLDSIVEIDDFINDILKAKPLKSSFELEDKKENERLKLE